MCIESEVGCCSSARDAPFTLTETSHYWPLLTASLSWFRKCDNPLCVFPLYGGRGEERRGGRLGAQEEEVSKILILCVLVSNPVGLNLQQPFRTWSFLNSLTFCYSSLHLELGLCPLLYRFTSWTDCSRTPD